MKKVLYVLLPLVCFFAGCAKEMIDIQEVVSGNDNPVFRASFNSAQDTRTVLGDDQKQVLWSATDEISIFDGINENYEYVASGAGESTSFSDKSSTGSLVEPETYYALYPYDANAEISEGVITTTLNNEYSVTQSGSFSDGMNIAVAKSSTTALTFNSVLSWLAVASKGLPNVTKIEMTGNNDEILAGKILIDYNGDTPLVSVVEGTGKKTMVINVENFEESDSEPTDDRKYFYVPVLPGTLEKGFTLNFTSSDGVTRPYAVESKLTFKSGKRKVMHADLTMSEYKRVKDRGDLEEVENGEFLLVYPSGSDYLAFSFQKTMENAVAEADRLSDVHTLEDLKNQATTIYQNILKTNYVTATSTDGGETITIAPEDEEEAIVVVNGGYQNAETTLSANVDGKAFTLKLEKITAELKDNNSVLLSAVLNGEDLMDIAETLRGHDLTLTFENCIDYVGPKCSMTSDQIAIAKRFFTKLCGLVEEYTGQSFPVTLSTTVTNFYRQYWDNIRDYAIRFGEDKKWGSAYPIGFFQADDGFTFNIPVPNSVWFSEFEQSTSRDIQYFIDFWSAKDGYHNFPFKRIAEKFAENLDDETFAAIKALNFDSLGSVYQRYVDRFNDSLEEVYLYKKAK